jgi:hypothetical protein
MNDFERISRIRHDLETLRQDLCQRMEQTHDQRDLNTLHERVSRAIKALSGQG